MTRRRLAAVWVMWAAALLLYVVEAEVVSWVAFGAWIVLLVAPVRRRPPVDLPIRRSTEPFRAAKMARLVVQDGKVEFQPVFASERYGPESTARCFLMVHGDGSCRCCHRPPDLQCSCGFYALKPGWRGRTRMGLRVALRTRSESKAGRLVARNTLNWLDVELSGRVIVCRRGFRAQHQRVLSVRMSPWCVKCRRSATGFYAGSFFRSTPTVTSTCGCQVPVRWSLSDLANMAGTEFRWDRKPLLTRLRRGRKMAA